jgi:hypothetical protein
MRPSLLILLVLAPSLLAQSLGDIRDLSDAYNKARSLAHSYRSTAPTWSEPSWNPASGPSFTQEPPGTPEQKALEQRTETIKKRIAKLTTNREHWRVALERVQQNQNWRKDLQYYAEESQAAQIGALVASLTLLVGASGPMETAMETHAASAGAIFKNLGASHEKLRRARALLEKASRNPRLDAKGRQTLELLLRQHAELVTGMREQIGLMKLCKNLRSFADRAMDTVTTLELADDMIVKQDLSLAQQLVTDAVIDILKEAGLVKLKRIGFGRITKGARLLTFAIDYSYQGAKFFDAWWNVDRILSQEEDRQKIASQMGRTIVQMTDKVSELRGDLSRLEAAKNASADQQKQLLYEQRAKDHQQAHALGEWFANESGIRAPGEPIN